MAGVYRGLWVVAYRELLRFTQDRPRMVSSFAFPLMFLLIFGAGFSNIIGTLTPGVDFMMFMYPGIIAMSVLTNSLFAGVSIVWDREFGFLKEVLVAPISRAGVVLGKAVGGSVVALGQTLVMLALAPFMGLTVTPLLLLKLIPTIAIISLCLVQLGNLGGLTDALPARFPSGDPGLDLPLDLPGRGVLPDQQRSRLAPGDFQNQPLDLWRGCDSPDFSRR